MINKKKNKKWKLEKHISINNKKKKIKNGKLKQENIAKIFKKGTDKKIDSYSAFFDNARKRKTGLEDYLKQKKVKELYIVGLATDYCVKFSVLDALELGFKVYLIEDACKGVNLKPKDVDEAIEEMRSKGALIIQSSAL